MPLIPYAEFAFDVAAPATEVRERLRVAVGRGGGDPGRAPPPPFEGDLGVDGASFALRRRIRYRNSFRPEIRGRTEPVAQGAATRVSGVMRPPLAVLAFAAVWLGAVGLGCARALEALAAAAPVGATPADGKLALGLLGMFLFGYALVTGGFSYEARQSLGALRAATGATGPSPASSPAA